GLVMKRDFISLFCNGPIFVICGVISMSNTFAADNPVRMQGFAISAPGDRAFGQNDMGVWVKTGIVRIGISNRFTEIVPHDFRGVGAVETMLTHSDLDEAKEVQRRLCESSTDPLIDKTPEFGSLRFSVDCFHEDSISTHAGYVLNLPSDVSLIADIFFKKVLKNYSNNGIALVRVEAAIDDIEKIKDKFLASIKFSNSGRYSVSIRTSDEWDRSFDRLTLTGWNEKHEDKFREELAGLPLVNKANLQTWTRELPDGIATFVEVPPGGNVTFKILVTPEGKVPKGTYKFSATIVTTMMTGRGGRAIENGTLNLGLVNFGTSENTLVTFDRDFPSTPEEWKEYEARERAKRSGQLIEPGEPAPGAGYYRLVSDSGQRSRFVRRLRNGQSADVREGELDEYGKPMTGKIAFQWEGDDTAPVDCAPNTPCPRDGRWIPARRNFYTVDAAREYEMHGRERFFRAGEIMPETRIEGYSDASAYTPTVDWYWLGV
ncbi:MAG TPA: hypothetical protein VGG24_02800, partial [Paraburkholderia sp.]